MKILFLTDNFPPEVNAPATRTYEHAKIWASKGEDVTVITCAPNFPQGRVYAGYKNRFFQKEEIDGIKVIRVWSYISANKGFVKRTFDFVSYAFMAFFIGLFQKTDIIVATSPQFFTAISGKYLSWFKSKPWIMEVRDIWPESIKTVGAMEDNWVIRYFEFLERRCYQSATKIIVVTKAFKKNLINKGVESNKIEIITNGANLSLFKPRKKDTDLIEKLGLVDKRIYAYIGTHGMAHKLDFLLETADLLRDNEQIHFLFIGAGAEKDNLIQLNKELKLPNATFLDPVSKAEIVNYLSIVDVAMVNLKKDPLFKTVIPSKIFENASMRIPILIGVDGESRLIIESYKAGYYYDPENSSEFLKAVRLIEDKANYKNAQIGCDNLAKAFNRADLADQMLEYIKMV